MLTRRRRDYLLDSFGSTRFGISVDPNGSVVLAVLVEDWEATLSIACASAALVRNHQEKGRIALACRDMRIENSSADFEIPIRLWIPLPESAIDGFFKYGRDEQKRLRLRAMKKIRGRRPAPGAS